MSTTGEHHLGEGLHPFRPMGWLPVFALLAGLGAAYTWSRSPDRRVAEPSEYSTTYHFGYSADIPSSSDVYDDDALRFGDPVYLKVIDEIEVAVDVELDAAAIDVTGASMVTRVVVSSDAGWSRVLSDTGAVEFAGTTASSAVPVDFVAAQELATSLKAATGVEGKISVTVVASVSAVVHLAGEVIGGSERVSVTSGNLVFNLNPKVAGLDGFHQLSPLDVVAGIENGTGASGDGSLASLATQSVVGTATVVRYEPDTLSIGKWDVRVDHLRAVTLIAMALFVLAWLYDLLVLWLARRNSEAAYLEARFGAGIFPVQSVPPAILDETVWVGSFETLAVLASDAEADILHLVVGDLDHYFVFDGPRVFAFEANHRRVHAAKASAHNTASSEVTS